MSTSNLTQEERAATELLLAKAERERDQARLDLDEARIRVEKTQLHVEETQHTVDWLLRLLGPRTVEQMKETVIHNNGTSSVTHTTQSNDQHNDDDDHATPITTTVYNISRSAGRKLTVRELTVRFTALGRTTSAKTAQASIKNAVKSLVKQGKMRKIGTMHYRAIEPKEPAPAMQAQPSIEEQRARVNLFDTTLPRD